MENLEQIEPQKKSTNQNKRTKRKYLKDLNFFLSSYLFHYPRQKHYDEKFAGVGRNILELQYIAIYCAAIYCVRPLGDGDYGLSTKAIDGGGSAYKRLMIRLSKKFEKL